MSHWIHSGCRSLLELWQRATPGDYLQVVVAVIIVGWFFSRYGSER